MDHGANLSADRVDGSFIIASAEQCHPDRPTGNRLNPTWSRQALALAMPRSDYASEGTKLKIKILGSTYNATVVGESPFDAWNAALRA
ncbi:hypothetical protein GFM14_26555 [Rhizobium leguminosarum bv. viciae]|nr:hypothetical protein [Rhizobium leguminosarum bv. viciae]